MKTFVLRKENISSAIENGRKLLRCFSKHSTLNVKVSLQHASAVQYSAVHYSTAILIYNLWARWSLVNLRGTASVDICQEAWLEYSRNGRVWSRKVFCLCGALNPGPSKV